MHSFPLSYNFFDDFPECDFGIIDSLCNGSYAFSVIKAISHRICRKLRKPFILSSTSISKCDVMNDVCYGGSQVGTYKFLEKIGVPNNKCQPWPENVPFSKHQGPAHKNTKSILQKQIYSDLGISSDSPPEEIKNAFLQTFQNDDELEQTLQFMEAYFDTHPSESFDSDSFLRYLNTLPFEQPNLTPKNDDYFQEPSVSEEFYDVFTRYSYSICQKCQDETMNMTLYKTKLNSTRRLFTINDMKTAIIERGPITATIYGDKSLKTYSSGIFTADKKITAEVGDYTIELIGWGSILPDDDSTIHKDFLGQQYWIGLDNRPNFGLNGQIKILMGTNELLIEDFAYEAEPYL